MSFVNSGIKNPGVETNDKGRLKSTILCKRSKRFYDLQDKTPKETPTIRIICRFFEKVDYFFLSIVLRWCSQSL
ncbi:hypothetical protein LEP1GSC059_4092 [Leptospira noguchii serovar Panama str. CZ214]|uniref:Uncharacterized protein n=1 Tax=Leptospira noguchii serovar Panama str. CZ214 TaxID=1001595 RepID=T0FK48_9LEPT|nr:hypothetical protein LEP1GSC059_4092 [Leptospira noguchii serovar Panama str. CZ214]